MFKINRKVEYALLALKHLYIKVESSVHKEKSLVTTKLLSETYFCPPEIMAKVLHRLARSGFLESIKGAHGGYRLIKDLEQVSFYELIESILGPLSLANCLGEYSKNCEQAEHCTIISPLYRLNEQVLNLFKTITVAELIQLKKIKKEEEIRKKMLAFVEANNKNEKHKKRHKINLESA